MQALQLLNRDLEIIVIWNKEAQHMLFDRNPRCYAALTHAVLEAILLPCPRRPIQSTAELAKMLRSVYKKPHDSALTKDPKSITTAPNLIALTNNNLRLKFSDWRFWA